MPTVWPCCRNNKPQHPVKLKMEQTHMRVALFLMPCVGLQWCFVYIRNKHRLTLSILVVGHIHVRSTLVVSRRGVYTSSAKVSFVITRLS